jgi:hypothetical protein
MKYQEIDPWCDLFERRLRRGDHVSIDDFLKQNHLPDDRSLVAELQKVESEYRPKQSLPDSSSDLAEAADIQRAPPPTSTVPSRAGREQSAPTFITQLKGLLGRVFRSG